MGWSHLLFGRQCWYENLFKLGLKCYFDWRSPTATVFSLVHQTRSELHSGEFCCLQSTRQPIQYLWQRQKLQLPRRTFSQAFLWSVGRRAAALHSRLASDGVRLEKADTGRAQFTAVALNGLVETSKLVSHKDVSSNSTKSSVSLVPLLLMSHLFWFFFSRRMQLVIVGHTCWPSILSWS